MLNKTEPTILHTIAFITSTKNNISVVHKYIIHISYVYSTLIVMVHWFLSTPACRVKKIIEFVPSIGHRIFWVSFIIGVNIKEGTASVDVVWRVYHWLVRRWNGFVFAKTIQG